MSYWNEIKGVNAAYIAHQYERYLISPLSVEPDLRKAFDEWGAPDTAPHSSVAIQTGTSPEAIVSLLNLSQAIRLYGHFAASLDPLSFPAPGDPTLSLEYHNLDIDTLQRLPAGLVGGRIAEGLDNALQAIEALRATYSSSIGYDFLQIRVPEERTWLRDAVESGHFQHPPIDRVALLERLTQVEVFEQFLQRAFPAKTRFSIEGLDILVPMLDELVDLAIDAKISHALLGMAHRGRLNVLAHVLNLPYAQLLAEFKDPLERRMRPEAPFGWTGDVKYHMGARHEFGDGNANQLRVTIAPNPSHLEAVNPVVVGMARAAGMKTDNPGDPVFNPKVTLPVLIHGDAAFPGQGVVAETFNLYNLKGYTTGGTIHIIANNQLGYTTLPSEGRSTIFASDLAKGFRAPIVHVNADDPAACIQVTRLAMAYRERFNKDFVIDLIGYRRLGHNEGDEPEFTQPRLYQVIRAHPTVRQILADQLVREKIVNSGYPQELIDRQNKVLQHTLENLDPIGALREPPPASADCGQPGCEPDTTVGYPELVKLQTELLTLPDGFSPHPKLLKNRQRKAKAFEDPDWATIDWAQAEELALASILSDGIPIRMTGQDVERGTFSHRHAVLHDVNTGERYTPLQSFTSSRAAFEIHNSPLSEMAALGFEFGYNVQAPERMVIWEAQYGDFINGAQTIIDEFIVSARSKWNQFPSLVMLLPHAYEGQGPDHSSARLERFLSLFAENNIRVANCTTAAQFFHLLRRQALLLASSPAPLVVMAPKSLLRHPLVSSPPRHFFDGKFLPVLTSPESPADQDVRRLILCSGKIAIDIELYEYRANHPEVQVARMELLAPFPTEALQEIVARFRNLRELVWVQEEPINMGAWTFVRDYLHEISKDRLPVRLISRPRSASPAEGSAAMHTFFQRDILVRVFSASQE